MSTGIKIETIQNEQVRQLAKTIDQSGVSKTDGYLDELEVSAFAEKVKDTSGKDWTELMGLFKTEKTKESQRAELSWGEIGTTALKSTKNFVKSLFCDEDGFSTKRTLTTVGTVAALAFAAPAAAALGAGSATVGAIALGTKVIGTGLAGTMLYQGGKNVAKGTRDYYNAESHDQAQEAMNQAMDGAVESAMALPAAFGIFKGANKGVKLSQAKRAKAAEAKQVHNKPVEQPKPEIKPQELKIPEPKVEYHADCTETTEFYANGKVKTYTKEYRATGGKEISEYDMQGNLTRLVTPSSRNGGVYETKYTTDSNGLTRETYHKATIIKDSGNVELTEKFYGEISKKPERIVEKLLDKDGKEVETSIKKFIYSDNGKIIKSIEEPIDYHIREIETYYHNDLPTTRIKKYVSYSGIGEKDVIEFRNDGSVRSAYRYDRSGSRCEIDYYQKAKEFNYPI